MPSDSTPATAQEIRRLALVQLSITAVFLAVVFWILGGTDADYPPVWISVLIVVLIVVGVVLSERVWLSGTALDPEAAEETNHSIALEAFANQTVRKLMFTQGPLVLSVLLCFVGSWGGWPVLIAAGPGLLAQAWETWPNLRNTSMSAAILEAEGADSRLVESFRRA